MSKNNFWLVLVLLLGIGGELIFLLLFNKTPHKQNDASTISTTPAPQYINTSGSTTFTLGKFLIGSQKEAINFSAQIKKVYTNNGQVLIDTLIQQGTSPITKTFVVLLNGNSQLILTKVNVNSLNSIATKQKNVQINSQNAVTTLQPLTDQVVFLNLLDPSSAPFAAPYYQKVLDEQFGNNTSYKVCNKEFMQSFAQDTPIPACTPLLNGITVYDSNL